VGSRSREHLAALAGPMQFTTKDAINMTRMGNKDPGFAPRLRHHHLVNRLHCHKLCSSVENPCSSASIRG